MGHTKSASSQSTQRNQHGTSSRDPFSSLPESCQVPLELVWEKAHAVCSAIEGILLFREEAILSAYGIAIESLAVLPPSFSKQMSLKYLSSQSSYFPSHFSGLFQTSKAYGFLWRLTWALQCPATASLSNTYGSSTKEAMHRPDFHLDSTWLSGAGKGNLCLWLLVFSHIILV